MKPPAVQASRRRRARSTVAVASVVMTAAAVLSATPANAATNHNPVGAFDAVGGGIGTVAVKGWDFDPDSPKTSIKAIVTVGGKNAGTLAANVVRADVNRVKKVSGNHGYSGTVTTSKTGKQSVCVVAVNVGSGANKSLGCKTATIASANPVGNYESATGGAATVKVVGWTYDPNSTSASNKVSVAVGGTTVGTLAASVARPDVDRVKKVSGNHGYSGSLSTTKTGKQSVCVTAVNSGPGANISLGCKTVTITAKPTATSTPTPTSTPSPTSTPTPTASASPSPASSAAPTASATEPVSAAGGPSGEVMPTGSVTTNGRTWTQIYAQDFDTDAPVGTFLSKYKDVSAYDGYKDTSGQGLYAPDKVLSASGGVLDFDLHSENGQPLVSSISPGNYMPMTTGRVSIRYKTTKATGYKFVGILWPEDDVWNEGEIDWPEADLGGVPRPASAIPGTYANGNMSFAPGKEMFAPDDSTGWHTATTEWDHGIVRFYWDGKLITSVTNAVPTTPFRLALQAETWIGEGAVPTSSVGHVDIDWVTMWK